MEDIAIYRTKIPLNFILNPFLRLNLVHVHYPEKLERDNRNALKLSKYRVKDLSSPPINDANDPFIVSIKSRLNISDPYFHHQWHLINRNNIGHDINVTGVWLEGKTNRYISQGNFGQGVVVALLDDGIYFDHPDIRPNFVIHDLHNEKFSEGSNDLNDHKRDPSPKLPDDTHGTRCAGQIAAAPNDVCGVGVAYKSKVAGIRMLSKEITSIDEATALNFAMDKNHIYSSSWGPKDDGETVEGPDRLNMKALINGITKGRNGKGSIYVVASGNGKEYDNCNYDGYANSVFNIAIGAIDRYDNSPVYMENCASQLFVTYSSDSHGLTKITTTDVEISPNPINSNYKPGCTDRHGGTSAAAPLGAGILALALSARPELTWRDMQNIAINSVVHVQQTDKGWQLTGSGRKYHHKFGFGKIDAWRLVQNAKKFPLLGPLIVHKTRIKKVNQLIPQNGLPLSSSITVTSNIVPKPFNLEQVTVKVNLVHNRRGDIEFFLETPFGTVAQLSTKRENDFSTEGLKNWTFSTVIAWGEEVHGSWSLKVFDKGNMERMGKLMDWQLAFWGETTVEFKNSLHDYQDAEKFLDVYFPSKTELYFSENEVDLPGHISIFFKVIGALGLIFICALFIIVSYKFARKRLSVGLMNRFIPLGTMEELTSLHEIRSNGNVFISNEHQSVSLLPISTNANNIIFQAD
ncbi:Peptidase S8, subtilisin-related domain-containing protein [Rozella allomycis CSF55]|uniref:Peptidase S8, subtilisin-related domain-containing protein n=1 Tax=Rozella allomycis (strain CSF55) TaxID=988480 RepID=A0A075AYW8_ROZAC|nr:Peptidase S8, subtilisin-related domain-containing protein [Rozella allomycis CSF55]|eukprot:EPZ35500.1 Peptidase S8, subtilisin-related domain-containing protein [Rozella allomycis CSF55]